jgi:hypothetical protein
LKFFAYKRDEKKIGDGKRNFPFYVSLKYVKTPEYTLGPRPKMSPKLPIFLGKE